MLRDYKGPDLHKPRYRPTSLMILNKAFFDKVRRYDGTTAGLSDQAITSIIETAGALLHQKVMAERDGVELPEQLGYLFVGSTPATKKRNIDYKRSIELGKEVHHQNWETDGLTGKIFYTNYETKYRFKYHELWKFLPVRQFKKSVSKAYLSDHTRYVKIDNWVRVSKLFKQNRFMRKVM